MTQSPDLNLLLQSAIFAAKKHQGQVRKDQQRSPYITHPLLVAQTLYQIGGVSDTTTLVAAILHDTIEDTHTTNDELREAFGDQVLSIVLEVSDNKSLIKNERKRLQVIHAAHLSHQAKMVKLGDKLINCQDVLSSPPCGWSLERLRNYIQWAADVVENLRHTNDALEGAFDQMIAEAETQLQFSIKPFDTIDEREWAP